MGWLAVWAGWLAGGMAGWWHGGMWSRRHVVRAIGFNYTSTTTTSRVVTNAVIVVLVLLMLVSVLHDQASK